MSERNYYTPEGLNKLKEELYQLKIVERSRIAKAINEARQKGDLSENAEYHAAKEAQGLLEIKIGKLEEVLNYAALLDDSNIDSSKVLILSTVKIKNKKSNQVLKYKIVSEKEADLKLGKISIGTPIAKALLGKKVKDVVEVDVPSGKMKFEILEISR